MKFSPIEIMKFKNYVDDAKRSVENISFIIEELEKKIDLDYSFESLVSLESIYWELVSEKELPEFLNLDHFSLLISQYLGESIIFHTKAKWVQSKDKNHLFGQPCIDGFGGKAWDRIYPVSIALHIRELPVTKPDFPGVKEKCVFALKFKSAILIYRKSLSLPEA